MPLAAVIFMFYSRNLQSARVIISAQGMALEGTQQAPLVDPIYVHAHCTEGVIMPEGREGANEDGNGVGVGGENSAETVMETEAEQERGSMRRRAQDGDGNGNESGYGNGNANGYGDERTNARREWG